MSNRFPVLMGCGHVANARNGAGGPSCIICVGIHPGAEQVAEQQPSLDGRMSECWYCHKAMPSSLGLAFFEYRPGYEVDSYYCGCRGWD